MEILFAIICGVLFVGCLLAFTRSQHWADTSQSFARTCQQQGLQLKSELVRLDNVERRLEKLSGRFYRSLRDDEPDPRPDNYPPTVQGSCDNWSAALLQGPRSAAASCECDFCVGMREQRKREKAAILKTRPLVAASKQGE